MWVWVLLLSSLTFTATSQQELTPGTPLQVTAVTRSCSSINVTWDAVLFNGIQLDMYRVFYREDSANTTEMITVNGLDVLLTGLNHLTTYKIRVAAVNGSMSPEIENTTFGAVQGTNLRVDNVTNNSAIFSWEIARPNIGCNGRQIETAFCVRYRSENTEQQRINVRDTSVKLPNLLPFTNYTVHVVTNDPSGRNVRSSDLPFTSLPGVPSVPMNLNTVINNSVPTQVLITWEEPLTLNGIVAHYDVEFSEQGLSSQMVNTGDTNLFLTGLNPSGVYVVRVRANNYAQLDLNENDVIPGPFTDIITVQLPDPLPTPPGHPRDFKVAHNVFYGTRIELEFSWKPPTTGGPVDTYWIMCNKSFAGDESSVVPLSIRVTLPTLHLRTKITGDPFTAYHCNSFASNNVGNGPFSRTVSSSTIPLASSPVQYLSAVPLNHSHVRLSWIKPNARNDYVASYLVTLRNPSTNTDTNFTVPATNTSLVVEALTGNTMYRFSVIAVTVFNGERLNSNVTSTTVTTHTGTPSHPRDVVVEAINQATVQVQWSPPMPTNGIIMRYRVDVTVNALYNTENGEKQFSDFVSTTVQDLYYTMPLLTPGAIYTFNITAYTNDGPGPTTSVRTTLNSGREDAITYFQLKLRPFMDCSRSQDTVTKQDIRNQLVHGLEEECACVLDPNVTITDIQTQCNMEDLHLIYIGRIVGTEELRPLVLFNLLENWKGKSTLVFSIKQ